MLRNKILLHPFCISIIILFCLILYDVINKNIENNEVATSYESLVINVQFEESTETINIWKDIEQNMYYFFLPSGSDTYEICFGNIGQNDVIYLGDESYSAYESIEIEYQKTYDMEFVIQGESQGVLQVKFLKSENLPSLFIETESGSVDNIHADKNIKEKAKISLLNCNGKQEYSSAIEYIKTRGNSTFKDFAKKPYQIKLSKSESLLGMAEAKKWILLANAVDDTLMRNELVFRFAKEYTSVPTIEGRYIDLYINGDYVGNYYLCEKVEIHKNRLNITDLEAKTKDINFSQNYDNANYMLSEDGNINALVGLDNPWDITGGYLVKHTVFTDVIPENSFKTNSGNCYTIVSPENATMEQAKYICNLFNELENALQNENGVNQETGKHFSEYIDVDSWASKYVIEEAFHDPDAAALSMYFYKDCDSVDPHIYCGPMWDYDRALGGYGANLYRVDNPMQVGEFGIYVKEMMKHEEVSALVYEKFAKDVVPYAKYLLSADVYNLYETIEASYLMDKIRWPESYGYYTEIEANIDYLINFLEQKVEYLKGAWLGESDYCEILFLDNAGNEYASYLVKRGEALGLEPTITTWDGIFNGWYSIDEGVVYDPRLPIYQDVTYQARWISIELLMRNGLQLADINISQVDSDVLHTLAEMVEKEQQISKDEGEE